MGANRTDAGSFQVAGCHLGEKSAASCKASISTTPLSTSRAIVHETGSPAICHSTMYMLGGPVTELAVRALLDGHGVLPAPRHPPRALKVGLPHFQRPLRIACHGLGGQPPSTHAKRCSFSGGRLVASGPANAQGKPWGTEPKHGLAYLCVVHGRLAWVQNVPHLPRQHRHHLPSESVVLQILGRG